MDSCMWASRPTETMVHGTAGFWVTKPRICKLLACGALPRMELEADCGLPARGLLRTPLERAEYSYRLETGTFRFPVTWFRTQHQRPHPASISATALCNSRFPLPARSRPRTTSPRSTPRAWTARTPIWDREA